MASTATVESAAPMASAPDAPPGPSQHPVASPDVLDWALKEYMAAKIQKLHIANQAGANLVWNHGQNIAKQLGLDATTAITPFPAPTTIIHQQPADVITPPAPTLQREQTPIWKQLALGGAMLGAGAALGPLGAMAVGAWQHAIDRPGVTVPPVAVADPGRGNVGLRIDQ